MQINEDYKIESDSLNVTLYRKSKPRQGAKVQGWRPEAYFSNPHNLLQYLVKNEIMGDGMKDMESIVQKINELFQLINNLSGLPQLQRAAPRLLKDNM